MMLFLLTDTNCFLVSVNMYDIGVCMHMCIYRYVCVCPCMWKPEVDVRWRFQFILIAFFETGSLTKRGGLCRVGLAGQ